MSAFAASSKFNGYGIFVTVGPNVAGSSKFNLYPVMKPIGPQAAGASKFAIKPVFAPVAANAGGTSKFVLYGIFNPQIYVATTKFLIYAIGRITAVERSYGYVYG